MAYSLAEREALARTPGAFADQVAGALNTHAEYRVRNLAVPEGQSQADYDLAVALIADTDAHMRPAMRLILHSAEQSNLAEVSSLTDAQVIGMVETIWPYLRAVSGVE